MKLKTPKLAAIVLVASISAAQAQTANVPFAGVVTSTCVLTVGVPGVLAASPTYNELSSTAAGGVAGTIQALATGATFKVSATAPSSFTLAPDGGDTGVSFSTSYSGAGSTTIGQTPGATETTLNLGLTNLSVNLAANKSSGTFPGGAYAAEVVVRCE